jgi:hypothetical protein
MSKTYDDPDTEDQEGLPEEEYYDNESGEFEDDGSEEGDEIDGEEDDQEEGDEEGEEEDDEEGEQDGEEDRITFEYENPEGQSVPIDLSVEDIPELFEKAVFGMKTKEHVDNLTKYIESNRHAIQVGQVVAQSELLQQAALWKINKFTDKQIATALYQHFMGNNNIDGEEEEVGGSPDLEKLLDAKLAPITQKLQQTESDLLRERTNSYNDSVITGVLSDTGVGKLTDSERNNFIKVWQELYPGFDAGSTRITQRQVSVALKESGILEGRKPATQKNATVKPGKDATKPKLIKGKGTKIAPGSTKTQAKKQAVADKSDTREAMKSRAFARGIF